MLAVGAGHGQDQRVIADVVVLGTPCGHIRAGIGPADADAALICRLPAVGAAPHPVVVVAQRHQPNTVLLGQLHGTVHGPLCVQGAKAAVAIPALHRTKTGHALCLGGRVDAALFQVIHHHREAIQAVAEHTGQTILGENFGGIVGTVGGEAVFFQYTLKLGQHRFISNSHGYILLLSPYRESTRTFSTIFFTSSGASIMQQGRWTSSGKKMA